MFDDQRSSWHAAIDENFEAIIKNKTWLRNILTDEDIQHVFEYETVLLSDDTMIELTSSTYSDIIVKVPVGEMRLGSLLLQYQVAARIKKLNSVEAEVCPHGLVRLAKELS